MMNESQRVKTIAGISSTPERLNDQSMIQSQNFRLAISVNIGATALCIIKFTFRTIDLAVSANNNLSYYCR